MMARLLMTHLGRKALNCILPAQRAPLLPSSVSWRSACTSAGWQISHVFPKTDATLCVATGCTLPGGRPLC